MLVKSSPGVILFHSTILRSKWVSGTSLSWNLISKSFFLFLSFITENFILYHSLVSPLVDGCSSTPCLNGATCENHVDSYTCTCTPDWTGVKCGEGRWKKAVETKPRQNKKFPQLSRPKYRSLDISDTKWFDIRLEQGLRCTVITNLLQKMLPVLDFQRIFPSYIMFSFLHFTQPR